MVSHFCLSILMTIFVTTRLQNFGNCANIRQLEEDLAVQVIKEEVKVDYHLWYDPNPANPDPSLPQSQFHLVAIEDQSTFFQVMKKAAEAKPVEFSFDYTEYPFGRFITKIGGVEQDVEGNIFWMIYKLNGTPDPQQPPGDDLLTPTGVDMIKVSEGDIYLFWRRVVVDSRH